MTIQSISEEVRRIQKKYGESDPFRLAQAMKIIVVLNRWEDIKGAAKDFMFSTAESNISQSTAIYRK